MYENNFQSWAIFWCGPFSVNLYTHETDIQLFTQRREKQWGIRGKCFPFKYASNEILNVIFMPLMKKLSCGHMGAYANKSPYFWFNKGICLPPLSLPLVWYAPGAEYFRGRDSLHLKKKYFYPHQTSWICPYWKFWSRLCFYLSNLEARFLRP